MTCPICSETINDGASVCRFCQHDLTSLTPVLEKLTTTQNAIKALSSHVTKLEHDPFSLQAVCITIFFAISLTLSFIAYWSSWQWWAATDWPLHVLAFCAPFPAAIWLGAFAGSPSPRRSLLFGFLAGAGGFLIHLLISSYHTIELLPAGWPLSLLAFTVAGALLFPSGCVLGSRITRKQPDGRPNPVSAPTRPFVATRTQPALFTYVQIFLGFLGPIIVAIINRSH